MEDEIMKKLDKLIVQQERTWLNNDQASKYLQVSRRTLQNMRKARLIAWSQIGRKIWYSRKDLDTFIEAAKISRPK